MPTEVLTGHALCFAGDLLRGSGRDDLTAVLAAAGAEIDDPIGVGDHVEIVFDDDYRSTLVDHQQRGK